DYRAAFYVTAALLLAAGVVGWFGIREVFTPAAKQAHGSSGMLAHYATIMARPAVTAIFVIRFVSQMGLTMIIPVTPLFIQTELPIPGGLNAFVGLISAVVSATTSIGSISLGRLSDRLEKRSIVIACSLIAAAAYWPQSMVTNGWQLLIL